MTDLETIRRIKHARLMEKFDIAVNCFLGLATGYLIGSLLLAIPAIKAALR